MITRSVSREQGRKSLTEVKWYVWEDDEPTAVRPATDAEIDSQTVEEGELVSDGITIILAGGRTLINREGLVHPLQDGIENFQLFRIHGVHGDDPQMIAFDSREDVDSVIEALVAARDLVFPKN